MKPPLTLLALLLSTPALANPAYFTGQMELVMTVTGKTAVRCEYNYGGQNFWRTLLGMQCPYSIDVE